MSRRPKRLAELALEADLDLDEALVTLWDAGIDYVDDPRSIVRSPDVARAQRALGVAIPKEQLTVDYWLRRSGLSRHDLCRALAEVSISLSPSARRIPKNSLRRLERMFTDNGAAASVEPTPVSAAQSPLTWETIGNECEVRCLDADEIRRIHAALEEDFAGSSDPIFPPGVKSENLLSSAASRPHTGLGESRKYPTREMAAAALYHSVIHNHPFHNGNKRTALVCLLAMLDENGLVLTATQEELFRFTLRTAQHGLVPLGAPERADREVLTIARWVRMNSRSIERGERPLKWVRLKQRLAEFGCDWAPATVGNRLNITREVLKPSRFGFSSRRVRLSTQVAYAGDGTEADRNTVHKIRRDLRLDDERGVDSRAFYAGAPAIDAFIIEYRRILGRLARL